MTFAVQRASDWFVQNGHTVDINSLEGLKQFQQESGSPLIIQFASKNCGVGDVCGRITIYDDYIE